MGADKDYFRCWLFSEEPLLYCRKPKRHEGAPLTTCRPTSFVFLIPIYRDHVASLAREFPRLFHQRLTNPSVAFSTHFFCH